MFFQESYKLLLELPKLIVHQTLVIKLHTVSTKGVLCCLYFVVNFQVKNPSTFVGKLHKRKVITRLQQVSSFRLTVVVTKIIFKFFLVYFVSFILAFNKGKIEIPNCNLYFALLVCNKYFF